MSDNPIKDEQSGGLNFVFESGSSGRDNQKYVRSHAAKVGWSQRSRKKDAQKEDVRKEDAQKEQAPLKRRRKTLEQPLIGQPSLQQFQSESNFPINPAIHHPTHPSSAYSGSHGPSIAQSLSSPTHPPVGPPPVQQQFPPVGSNFYANPITYDSSTAFARSSSLVDQPPAQQNLIIGSSPPATTHEPASAYGVSFRPSLPYHPWPSLQHSSSLEQLPVQEAALNKSNSFASSANQSPPFAFARHNDLPSPAPSPPLAYQLSSGGQTSSSVQSSLTTPNSWRQTSWPVTSMQKYWEPPNSNVAVRKRKSGDVADEELADPSMESPPPARPGSAHFLDVILNPDYPLWPAVDSGNDSFGVFPVKWQSFYGRLLENYRSNMLVQLEEITTGWTLKDRLDFNQMPLQLAMSEPALFHALLAAAAIMMPPGLISPYIPQWLQSRTVKDLNRAFSDPRRVCSDAIILTVNLIALFESTGGHARAARSIHQPALRKMVDVRGGLESLMHGSRGSSEERDSRNLVRFLAWTDRVIGCQTGNPLIFAEFREDPTVSGTNWDDIWDRMKMRVESNRPAPLEEVPDE